MTEEALVRVKVSGGHTKIKQRSTSPRGIEHCPGCHYGIILRVATEVVEELGLEDRAICVADVGCNVGWVRASGFHFVNAPHGRSLVVATGIKRLLPEAVIFNIIGDGGLAAIGLSHFMNCMVRAEQLTTLFVNNCGYGMTGGQMAPTTLLGLRTTTTPEGRVPETQGFPLQIAELAATMTGSAYSARVSVHTPANFQKAKRAVSEAFKKQLDRVGYSVVEFLSACPTDWGLDARACLRFIADKVIAAFPLGEFKNISSIEYTIDAEVAQIGRTRRR